MENTDYVDPDQPHLYYCVKGVRACPPEDCGGVGGYEDFCDAMSDPNHPEHEQYKEWYGDEFDPEHFDIDEVNKQLGVKRTPASTKKRTKKS